MPESPKSSRIKLIFILGGLVNLSTAITFVIDNNLASLYPSVFSQFGIIAIMLWGLAYIAVSESYQYVRLLLLVFALEKAVYVWAWMYWLVNLRGTLDDPGVVSNGFDKFFLTGFGTVDFAWGIFFLWVYFHTGKQSQELPAEST